MKIKKYNEYRNISGNKLKELRNQNKMSQKQVAEKLQLEGVDLTEKEIHSKTLYVFMSIATEKTQKLIMKKLKERIEENL